jgi:S-DNA-T family DNA segregation ATPase FtsK/SpoIIIE
MVGAEKLLGKGDMLFSPAGLAKPQRIQGALISDKEVERLVKFIKDKNGVAVYDEEKIERITSSDKDGGEDDFGEDADEFIRDAINFVSEKGKASVSMLQRQFRIGYNRAARMMEMLEAKGVVGPEDGSKRRKVLIGGRGFDE